jgi:uncharacterized protein YcbX
MIKVAELNVYPVKGCRGMALQSMKLDARGPALDRRFMIVKPSGEFITQRQEPRLSLLRVAWIEDVLALHAPGMPELSIPLQGEEALPNRLEVRVWRFQGEALLVSERADAWLGQWLGLPCRLVRCAPDMERTANPEWTQSAVSIGFSDAYPLLLISEASLESLNEAIRGHDPMATPIGMNRFRPNLVVRGCEAFAEDDWSRICIGEVELDIVKPCDRCVVTTVNPETAERGQEPLITLARMRRSEQGVLFGQNCVPQGTGSLELGAEVQVLEVGGLDRLPDAWRISSVA